MTDTSGPRLVIDASAIVALLTDRGDIGSWVADSVEGQALCAPDLMLFEAANNLRRLVLSGVIDTTSASLAHGDLLDMTVELVP